MPPLQENFARLIAEGSTSTDAYRRLKPSSSDPSGSGSRLWSRLEIRIRVAEIVDEAVTARSLTIQQKIAMLEDQIEGQSPTKVKWTGRADRRSPSTCLGLYSYTLASEATLRGLWESQKALFWISNATLSAGMILSLLNLRRSADC